eukprot:Trichotokara_eunicae@DN5067_c0_g1_i2.p1
MWRGSYLPRNVLPHQATKPHFPPIRGQPATWNVSPSDDICGVGKERQRVAPSPALSPPAQLNAKDLDKCLVFTRLRPAVVDTGPPRLSRHKESNRQLVQFHANENGRRKECIVTAPSNLSAEERRSFRMDDLFHEDATQEEVYGRTAKSFVPKVFEGRDCALIAYGPTGTGKTYTMMGEGEEWGIVPRMMDEILQHRDVIFRKKKKKKKKKSTLR